MKNKRLNRTKRTRNYYRKQKMWLLWTCIVLLAAVFAFSSFKIGAYVGGYLASRKVSSELQQANEETKQTVHPVQTEDTAMTPAPTDQPLATLSPKQENGLLPVVKYPLNQYAQVTNRFRKLQQQNRDIIGWLEIEDVVNEAVVQRDNTYYLRRDYRGYHNQNGAIFLDENCALKTRPYTYMLYGHNMKNGAMFGFMKHYENIHYYQYHPFVTFDTAFENGAYVIFAVATISTQSYDKDYLDLSLFQAATVSWRQEAIDELRKLSIYNTSRIHVEPEDQILLMMTCATDDTERKVIAARRIRENETKEALMEAVQHARKKMQ